MQIFPYPGVYTDGSGNNWAPDTFYSGGTTGASSYAIGNTTDDPLYQAYRSGSSFSYNIPLSASGSYNVTLKFNEPLKAAAGQRKFDVSLEGNLVLDDFDVYAAAGGKNIAVDRTFSATVNDGVLNVSFTGVVDSAVISAIEVVWNGASPPTPTASYVYRGDNLRHSRTAGGSTTTYTWDVNSKLPVVLQDGAYTYVYGLGLISQTDGSGTQSYFLGNGLGSTEALTDASGTITANYKYDVFGAVRSSGGTGSTEYRFTGQQDDAISGYTYLRARYYDPATGRFISKDPFPGLDVSPTSQHYYSYTQNNPTNGDDPSGACPGCLALGLGLAAGAGLDVGALVVSILSGAALGIGLIAQLSKAGDEARDAAADCAGEPTFPNPQLTPTPGASQGIGISANRLTHVIEGHTPGGTDIVGNSVFFQGEDVVGLIRQSESVAPSQQAGGNFQRIVDAGRAIGIDRDTGLPTSVYTVITDSANNMITAFPGLP